MAVELVTGNHAAGYALSAAGEANRTASTPKPGKDALAALSQR